MLDIFKELAVTEDLELGFGTVTQTRDINGIATAVDYTKISSESIPAKLDDNSESLIQDVLDEKLTEQQAIAKYAKIGGDKAQEFLVKTPTLDDEAANKKYVDDEVHTSYSLVQSNFAAKSNVLEKDNISIYTPTDQYNPATKRYVDEKVIAVGAGDMAKATYDIAGNGIVDNAEAIGGISSDKVMAVRTNTTDVNTITKTGIYFGTGVANAPVNTEILVESFTNASGIAHQKLLDKQNGVEYTRTKHASAWKPWDRVITATQVVNDLISNDVDKPLSAKQGKVLNTALLGIKAVPIGTIVMYHGQLGSLSAEWAFCDGSGPTPDLRDMFISGAVSESDIGVIGGTLNATMPSHTHSAAHDHSATVMSSGDHTHSASHNHSASSKAAGAHTHTYDYARGSSPTSREVDDGSDFKANVGWRADRTNSAGNHAHTITVNTKSLTTSRSGDHTHSIVVAESASGTGAAGGVGDNRPPYYKLAYIMKIA